MKQQTISTIPSHTYEPTRDKNILRFVDTEGNWTHYWIKNKKMFVPAVNHIIRLGYPKGERFYSYLLHATPDEAEKRLKTAGEEGSRTHDALVDLIKGERVSLDTRYFNEMTDRYEPLSADEWHNIEAFANWAKKYDPRVLIYEHSLWSENFGYAGTLDFIGTIGVPQGDKYFPEEVWNTRVLILLDWKTSSAIWDEYDIQVAAYRKAALETLADRLPMTEYKNLWTGIVRLGTNHKEGFEMKVWDTASSEVNFELFHAVREIYDKKTGDEMIPEIRHIPAEFSIHIPRLRIIRAARKSRVYNTRIAEKSAHESKKSPKDQNRGTQS